MTDVSNLRDESRLVAPLGRRAAFIKWLIFGVLLPLLPFAARALAAWVDNSSSSLTFYSLVSDGELLVVATVISAAIIGDLLFDFTGSSEAREQGTKALLCAIALVAVVASVLMFGLVTLNNQDRNNSFQQAQEEVTAISGGGTQLQGHAAEAQARYNVETEQSQKLAEQAQYFLTQENAGVEGGQLSTHSPQYKALQQNAVSVEQEANATRRQAAQDLAEYRSLISESNGDQGKAERTFIASLHDLNIGERQAAYMSIAMFLVSFFIGLCTYLLPPPRPIHNGETPSETDNPSYE